MKKITLLMLLVQLLLNDYNAQSPTLTLPPNYGEFQPGGLVVTPLPQPNPSLWNATTASIYAPYGGPVDILEWKDQAYDGRPALGGHNAMYDVDGNLLFFIICGYVYKNMTRILTV